MILSATLDLLTEMLARIISFATGWTSQGCPVELLVDDQSEGNGEVLLRGAIESVTEHGLIGLKLRPVRGEGGVALVRVSPRYRHQTIRRLRVAELAVNVIEPYPGLVPSRAVLRGSRRRLQ